MERIPSTKAYYINQPNNTSIYIITNRQRERQARLQQQHLHGMSTKFPQTTSKSLKQSRDSWWWSSFSTHIWSHAMLRFVPGAHYSGASLSTASLLSSSPFANCWGGKSKCEQNTTESDRFSCCILNQKAHLFICSGKWFRMVHAETRPYSSFKEPMFNEWAMSTESGSHSNGLGTRDKLLKYYCVKVVPSGHAFHHLSPPRAIFSACIP